MFKRNANMNIEFIANPGDWAFHCHMSHHTMNAMRCGIANPLGVDQAGIDKKIQSLLPGYVPMGESGSRGMHHGAGFEGPRNTIPMMWGEGPFGPLEMGGMFTVLKVRDQIVDIKDAGWYKHPSGTLAKLAG